MSTKLQEKEVQQEESKELLKPKIDVVFHALFREENKKLLENLMSDILGEKIRVKTSDLNRHLNIKVAEQKLGVLDLRIKLENGTNGTLEIQLKNSEYENERFLYYWADAYSRQLEKGDTYGEIHKTISIIILGHEIKELKGMDDLNVKWQIRDNKTGKRVLTDFLEIVIVEIPKAIRIYEKDKNNKIGQWMMFLDNPNSEEMMNIMAENEEIKEAVDELKIMSEDEELRRIAELREKGIRDEHAGRLYERRQGIREGIMKTVENMLKKNIAIKDIYEITGLTEEELEEMVNENEELRRIAELREKGIRDEHAGRLYERRQGIREGIMKTAENMIKLGIDIELIIQTTGLTKEEIEKIKIA